MLDREDDAVLMIGRHNNPKRGYRSENEKSHSMGRCYHFNIFSDAGSEGKRSDTKEAPTNTWSI